MQNGKQTGGLKTAVNRTNKKKNQKLERRKFKSIYQKDYPKKAVKPMKSYQIEDLDPQFGQRRSQRARTKEKTRYQYDYDEKKAARNQRKPQIPSKRGKSTVVRTSYQKDYVEKELQNSGNKLENLDQLNLNDRRKLVAIDKHTSYMDDYPGWAPEPRKKAEKVLNRLKQKFKGQSNYQREFKKKMIPKKNLDGGLEQAGIVAGGEIGMKSRGKMDDQTTFKADYVAHEVEAKKVSPKKRFKNTASVNIISTYELDFPEHDLEGMNQLGELKNPYINASENARQKRIALEKRSKYQEDYPGHEAQPVVRVTGHEGPRKKGKFQGKSSYMNEYVEFGMDLNDNGAINKELLENNDIGENLRRTKMKGETTFTRDYPGHQPQPAQPRQRSLSPGVKAKMQGKTSYAMDFVGHKTEPKADAIRSIIDDLYQQALEKPKLKKKSHYQEEFKAHELLAKFKEEATLHPKKKKFKGESTYAKAFQGELGGNLNQNGTITQEYISQLPAGARDQMQGETTFMADYPGHQPQPRRQAEEEVKMPLGKMNVKTSYNQDFVRHNLSKSLGPDFNLYKELLENGEGYDQKRPKFKGKTTFQADFTGKEVQRREMPNSSRRHRVKKGKFKGKSTYDKDFPGYEIDGDARKMYQSLDVMSYPRRSKQRMEGETTFHRDFKGHKPQKRHQKVDFVGKKKPKFDYKTSYNADYVELEPEPYNLNQFKDTDFVQRNPNMVKFEGETNYQKDYPAHIIEQREQEAKSRRQPPGKFQGQTTYNKNYKGEAPDYNNGAVGDLELKQFESPKMKMEGVTTFMEDFPGHQPKRVKASKNEYKRPKGGMQKHSSYQNDFIPHKIEGEELANHLQEVMFQGEKRGKGPKFDGKTHYQDQYVEFGLEKRKPHQPVTQAKKGKFNGTTTYNTEYADLDPNQNFNDKERGVNNYEGYNPEGKGRTKMKGETTFMRDYPGHKPAPAMKKERRLSPGIKAKMQGKTSYGLDYAGHEPQQTADALRDIIDDLYQSAIERPKFKGKTTFESDFIEHAIQTKGTPEEPLCKRKQKFRAGTSYNKDFVEHKMPRRERGSVPADNQPEYKKDKLYKMEGQTTFKSDFQPHDIKPRAKISQQIPEKIGKMLTKTSYGENYVQHQIPKTDLIRSGSVENIHKKGPRAKFNGSTNYNNDFVPHDLEGRQFRTLDDRYQPKKRKGKFKGKTTYSKDYKENQVSKKNDEAYRSMFKSVGKLPSRFIKMEGETTFQRDFKGHEPQGRQEKVELIDRKRPKMECKTSYNADYVELERDPYDLGHGNNLPVDNIDEKRRKVKFEATTENRDNFIPHGLKKSQSVKPVIRGANKAKFDGDTTYKKNFQKPKKQKFRSQTTLFQPADTSNYPKKQKMEFETNYNSEFQPKAISKKLEKRRNKYKTKKARKLVTSYGEDFKQKALQIEGNPQGSALEELYASQRMSKGGGNKAKMEFETNYNSNFVQFEIENKKQKPSLVKKGKKKFKGDTTYGTEFIGKDMEGKFGNNYASEKKLENLLDQANPKARAKFEGKTTYQREFKDKEFKKGHQGKRRKRSNAWKRPKMKGKTTYQSEFESHKANPSANKATAEQQRVSINEEFTKKAVRPKFKGVTSYNENFKNFENMPLNDNQRESQHLRKSKKKFNGKTMYNSEFKKPKSKKIKDLGIANRDMFKTQIDVRRSRPRFEGETSYNAEFKSHQIKRKRRNSAGLEAGGMRPKFDGRTTYNQEYIKKQAKFNGERGRNFDAGYSTGRSVQRRFKPMIVGDTTYNQDFKGV